MWWTQDGTYFTQVEQDGMGDKFNIGGRTMTNGPYPCFGMFLGSANPFYGLKVYEGIPPGASCFPKSPTATPGAISSTTGPEPPQHVQVEGGRPSNPDYVPTMARTARQDIGTTDKLVFEDRTALPGQKYAYEIMTEDAESGTLSGPSNFVTFPAAAPAVTFTDVRNAFNTSVEGHKFTSLQGKDDLMNLLDRAELEANRGQFGSLRTLWSNIKNNSTAYISDRDTSRALELSLSRLTKRGQLVEAGHLTAADVVPHTEAPPTPPAQPTTGPAGTGYPSTGVTVNGPYWANNRTTIDDVQYYIYEPLHPEPATAPVILFLHGYGALTTDYYQGWINHMVQKGFIVVWPKYQATILSTFANFPSNAQSAWTDALYRLQNFTWEHHVKPTLNADGSVQAIFVGHSFGGWISAWLAGQAATAVPSFAAPEAIVLIEPASLGLLPPINYAGINSNLRMLIVSADQDTIACSKDGVSIYTNTPQVPAAQKNYLFFNTDSHGAPALLGNHYFPTTNGYNDDAALDARDFFVTYKLSVAAATCMTVGNNCGYFLGSGSTNQVGMGAWSDGTAVKPMSYYADPTTLPHIVGCAP
jgi:pimeloyl-ACP methyl ester carboxylesterase